MLMQRDDGTLLDGQERHREFIAGKEATRKEIGDMLFRNFIQLVMFHILSVKIDRPKNRTRRTGQIKKCATLVNPDSDIFPGAQAGTPALPGGSYLPLLILS